jgi:hypothetical protein
VESGKIDISDRGYEERKHKAIVVPDAGIATEEKSGIDSG